GIGKGKRLKRLLTRWVDVFIPISNATMADQLSNPATKRVVLIPAAVELRRFEQGLTQQEARARLGLATAKKVVWAASRVVAGKGLEEFVRAAARVLETFPDTVFYLAGSGDPVDGEDHLLKHLQELARRLGIEGKVIFAGWQDDVPSIMAALDIFVHC